jgi:hypothetical protein
MSRVLRATAGREVLSSTERLMNGLLVEEEACFTAMESALSMVAAACWRRVEARNKASGRHGVEATIADLLPTTDQLVGAVLPPVGDLLATSRQRTWVALRRQLRAAESTISAQHAGLAGAAIRAVESDVQLLEREWFERARLDAGRAAVQVRDEMGTQAALWAMNRESLPLLAARWYDDELVRLPGSTARGAVWEMRVSMNAAARNASVALTNGLLLAGMSGWNQVVQRAG